LAAIASPCRTDIAGWFSSRLVMLRQFFNRNFSLKPDPGFLSFYNQELIW
jgi:hypothetical protein